MANIGARLPLEIQSEAGGLFSDLLTSGWIIAACQYDPNCFGNWRVDLARNGRALRLVKDRSQYMIAGPPMEDLENAGLWKAFNDLEEFRRTVSRWAMQPDQPS